MPLYEYRCEHCSSRFEQMLPMSSVQPTAPCVGCTGRAARVVTAVALHGAARPAPTMASMPTSLAGLGGTRDAVAHWRRQADVAATQAERHPELASSAPRVPATTHCNSYAPAAAANSAIGSVVSA